MPDTEANPCFNNADGHAAGLFGMEIPITGYLFNCAENQKFKKKSNLPAVINNDNIEQGG
jgi:hypothetical protein